MGLRRVGDVTVIQNDRIEVPDGFGLRGVVHLWERDYRVCRDENCPHLQELGNDPEFRPCPLGHHIELRALDPQSNKVCTNVLDNIIRQMNGEVAPYNLQVKYAGAGTDATATTDAQTLLNDEVGRVAVSSTQKLQQVGSYFKQLHVAFFMGINDCNANLQEFALFAGAATGAIDSGIAVARYLQAYGNKDNTKTISGIWTVTGSN